MIVTLDFVKTDKHFTQILELRLELIWFLCKFSNIYKFSHFKNTWAETRRGKKHDFLLWTNTCYNNLKCESRLYSNNAQIQAVLFSCTFENWKYFISRLCFKSNFITCFIDLLPLNCDCMYSNASLLCKVVWICIQIVLYKYILPLPCHSNHSFLWQSNLSLLFVASLKSVCSFKNNFNLITCHNLWLAAFSAGVIVLGYCLCSNTLKALRSLLLTSAKLQPTSTTMFSVGTLSVTSWDTSLKLKQHRVTVSPPP